MTNTATQLNEMRLTQRVEPHTSITVFNNSDRSYLGEVLNCSETGVMFSIYEPIEPGTCLEIELVDVPPDIDTHRKGHCKAEVIWSHSITPSLYAAGCRVDESSDMFNTMMKSYQRNQAV
ncbi:MAG: PilZ domain-containing protein [Oceanobacter sp.]